MTTTLRGGESSHGDRRPRCRKLPAAEWQVGRRSSGHRELHRGCAQRSDDRSLVRGRLLLRKRSLDPESRAVQQRLQRVESRLWEPEGRSGPPACISVDQVFFPFSPLPFNDRMNVAARPSSAPPPPVTRTSGTTSSLSSDRAFAIATSAVAVEPRLSTLAW